MLHCQVIKTLFLTVRETHTYRHRDGHVKVKTGTKLNNSLSVILKQSTSIRRRWAYFLIPQSDTSSRCETMDTELVRSVVCMFTPQLLLVLTAPIHGGMAKLSWPDLTHPNINRFRRLCPRHTRLRTLNADLHPLNHGLNSAWRLAQDRERWRQLVETATLQLGARSWWWWWWWWWRMCKLVIACFSVCLSQISWKPNVDEFQ